jgi:tetratricopeptide (TPR) repeat protein
VGAAEGAESDQHTRIGQALGTPAYMSPEQAAGQANAVGAATDVYGLGATLYAFLTGRPPLEGTTAEVLETVRQGKVPPPRALKKDVPRPLEAICRKAMALRPEERYATALELAADIEHWLADEPVSVYRDTLAERMGRWARRHRATVIAAACVGLATLLGVSVLAWQSEKGRWRLEREQMATDEARREAEANARRERQAIRDYFMRSAEDPAWKAVGLEPLRRKLLEEARTYLQGFLRTHGEDPELLAELAEAHTRLGYILAKLGDREQACAELKAALELEKRLAAAQPGEVKFRFHQSTNWNALGRYLGEMGRGTEARQALEHAVDLTQRLVDEYPDELEYLQRLSTAHSNLAELLKDLGNYPAARRSHERALELRERLVKLRPDLPGDQHNLALSCNDLGVLLRSRFGDQTGARQFYERAAHILKDLVEHHPLVPEYRWDLAMTQNNLGVLYEHLGDRRRARTAHERAMELNRRLHAEHPSVVEYRRDLSMNHFNLGLFLKDERDLVGARREIEQAVALREPLVQLYPKVPEYRQDLARCYKSLGTVLDELGDFLRAEQTLEKALALQQKLVEQNPRPHYRSELALAHNGLGKARGCRGDMAGRRQAHEKAVAISEQLVKEYPGVLPYALSLWESCYDMANLERENGQLPAAVDWSSRAIAALGGEFRGKLDVFARKYLRNSYRARALPLTCLGRHAEAVNDWDEAITLDDGSARHALLLGRGLSLAQFGEHARAVIDAEEGVRSANPTAEDLFDAAYIHAVSASKVLRDIREERAPPLTQTRRKEMAQLYIDRASSLLTQSVQKGYKDVKRLKTDKVLEPLRDRDDFQKLLKKVEAKVSEAAGSTPESPVGSPKK